MKAAVRGLASGEEDYEKYRRLFREKFVFLNVYCKSVADEHEPRGPEGPYRFEDRSVPVLVIKRWDGETILQQLGFHPEPRQAKRALAQLVDRALKKHGPVVPPRALRPLIRSMEKARAMLEKELPAAAIRSLQDVVERGADERRFPDGPPPIAAEAQALLAKLTEEALAKVERVRELRATDPDAADDLRRELRIHYRRLPEVEKALEALDEEEDAPG